MKAFFAVLGMSVVLGWAGVSSACETCGCKLAKAAHEHEPAAVEGVKAAAVADVKPAAVNAGNTICPVMGSAVTVDSPNKVEYQGKIYNLCCAGCKDMFLKDPEAALKKLAELEAAQVKK